MRSESSRSIASVAAAALAAFLAFTFIFTTRAVDRNRLEYELAAAKNPVTALLAGRDIPKGTRITGRDIRVARVPKAYLVEDALGSKRQVLGREAVTEIFAGEEISARRLSRGRSRRASTGIGPGRVALAVGTDEIAGVAGAIRTGDRVDVFATDEERARTILLFERVRVLGIGGLYPYAAPGTDGGNNGPVPAAGTTVVLELTPGQAVKLTHASETGKLRLALRSFE